MCGEIELTYRDVQELPEDNSQAVYIKKLANGQYRIFSFIRDEKAVQH